MIHYQLRCGSGHGFDGWFPGSASFDQQAEAGLLACPVCADTRVERAMMAPRVRTGARAVAPEMPAEDARVPAVVPKNAPENAPESASENARVNAPEKALVPGGPIPDQMRAMLQRVRAEVERRCEYVGASFAEQARAIHEGTQPPKAIYGESTPEEAEALAEDGIEVARIPWIPRADG